MANRSHPSGLKEIGIARLDYWYQKYGDMGKAWREVRKEGFNIVSTGDVPRDFNEQEIREAFDIVSKWNNHQPKE